jgi:hypothetical protein
MSVLCAIKIIPSCRASTSWYKIYQFEFVTIMYYIFFICIIVLLNHVRCYDLNTKFSYFSWQYIFTWEESRGSNKYLLLLIISCIVLTGISDILRLATGRCVFSLKSSKVSLSVGTPNFFWIWCVSGDFKCTNLIQKNKIYWISKYLFYLLLLKAFWILPKILLLYLPKSNSISIVECH